MDLNSSSFVHVGSSYFPLTLSFLPVRNRPCLLHLRFYMHQPFLVVVAGSVIIIVCVTYLSIVVKKHPHYLWKSHSHSLPQTMLFSIINRCRYPQHIYCSVAVSWPHSCCFSLPLSRELPHHLVLAFRLAAPLCYSKKEQFHLAYLSFLRFKFPRLRPQFT